MAKAFEATGFPLSPNSWQFVSVSPAFPCRQVDGGRAHVGTTFYMTANDARELSADLLIAADVAEPRTVPAIGSEVTYETIEHSWTVATVTDVYPDAGRFVVDTGASLNMPDEGKLWRRVEVKAAEPTAPAGEDAK